MRKFSKRWLNQLVVPVWVWNFWRFKMTLSGRMLLGATFMSLMGTISVQIPIYQIFCALSALLVVAFLGGLWCRPRVKITGELPRTATVGQQVRAEFAISNLSRRPAYDLSLGFIDLTKAIEHVDRDVSVDVLAKDDSIMMPLTLEPKRRGLHELPELRAYSTFPFDLFRSGSSVVTLPPLLVLPAFHALVDVDVPVGLKHQPGGIALTSNIGESPEYIGNRDYIPGEPVRRIDFRSWARSGKPVVREYQEEYYCRIALILDTHVVPKRTWGSFERWAEGWYFPYEQGPEVFPELEAAVSMTAALADALSRGEYLIDLFAAGPDLYVFQAGRHIAHFESVLEILACVEACRENPFATIAPALVDELAQISTAVCVFLDWDESRRLLTQTIVESGCQLKRLIIRDDPTTLPADDPAYGDCRQYSIKEVIQGLIDFT